MKHRPNALKIEPEKFKEMYYSGEYSNEEIANYFGVAISSLGSFRKRFELPPRGKKWAKGHPFLNKSHSKKTRDKISNTLKGKFEGEKNYNWKGGSYLTCSGYKQIRVATNVYRLEHRVVMERHIGRELTCKEAVHHINGDKLDNRIENLLLTDYVTHGKIHAPKGSRVGINSKHS